MQAARRQEVGTVLQSAAEKIEVSARKWKIHLLFQNHCPNNQKHVLSILCPNNTLHKTHSKENVGRDVTCATLWTQVVLSDALLLEVGISESHRLKLASPS